MAPVPRGHQPDVRDAMTDSCCSFLSLSEPGTGREDEQAVRLLRVEQGLTGQFRGADLGVDQALDGDRPHADLVSVPRLAELVALLEQEVRQLRCPGAGAAQCGDVAQAGGEGAGEQRMVVGVVELSCGGVGEPPIADATGGSHVPGPVAGERDPQRALPESLLELGDDLRGRVVQAVEDAEQTGADTFAGRAARRRVVPGESKQVIAFVEAEAESLRDGGDLTWH